MWCIWLFCLCVFCFNTSSVPYNFFVFFVLFCFVLFFNVSLIPCRKFGLLYLGKATTAARSVLLIPTSVRSVSVSQQSHHCECLGFLMCADVDACDCTQGLYKHHTRDCTVSWLWGKNPFCCFWGNKLASVLCPAFWSCALPAELFCPFCVFSSEWANFVYWHYMVTQAVLLFLRSGHEFGRVVSLQGGLRRGVVSPQGGLERGVISLRVVSEGGGSLSGWS